jgi:hypothetical protein
MGDLLDGEDRAGKAAVEDLVLALTRRFRVLTNLKDPEAAARAFVSEQVTSPGWRPPLREPPHWQRPDIPADVIKQTTKRGVELARAALEDREPKDQ